MLNLQVLALSLIPLFSGAIPGATGASVSPLDLLGIGETISAQFMIGTWKYSDDFFRWGITDKNRAKVKLSRGHAFMSVHPDGTIKMVNLFKPDEARWNLSEDAIIIYDPERPQRVSHIVPIRKRDQNRIWLLLPFSGGASGIGMIRVSEGKITAVENAGQSTNRTKNRRLRN